MAGMTMWWTLLVVCVTVLAVPSPRETQKWSKISEDEIVKLNTESNADAPNYKIGVGIADITGPAAEVNMMGYANPSQVTGGIHLRQFSRAFIIADINKPDNRAVFVSIDAGMQDQLVTLEVIKLLQAKYKDLYSIKNIAISGTHSHSGVAGFLEHLLFQVTSLGFIPEAFHAQVNGIAQSIENAHNNMVDGNIYYNSGNLTKSNINRSPSAYLNNPKEEREKYTANVDQLMTVLKLVDKNGGDLGMINWFAVHGTSMNNTNHLISGDNKGYASQLMEGYFNKDVRPGKGKFVAAFASSNLGDVSPNTQGAKCIDTGKSCDFNSSTCGGKNEKCIAFGPGVDMFDSTRIIAEYQYKKAMDLYKSATKMLTGPVSTVHQYLDMTDQTVVYNSTFWGKTCKAAMGFSFAAGTTDGPGAFNFKQGDTEGDAFWKFIVSFIKKPSAQMVECQKPKPILLPVGEMLEPYPWGPSIVDTQMIRIGQFAVVAVPGEFTTMSGRRTRDAVQKSLMEHGMSNDTVVVLAGLTNTYADYIATYEEYQVQRYEGASTVFGPHTLQGYINQFVKLSEFLAKGTEAPTGPIPKNLLSKMVSLLPPVVFDEVPPFQKFGGVAHDAEKSYKRNTTASSIFQKWLKKAPSLVYAPSP
ncbi:neutral ceramidase-like isoform X2 [Patiria miniata]|uniref:Neutral ceramidase n=1 Tax=Patiria miniata TaxID=46514 RepID=A0A914A898_PATMI|nr:neutral ceramidase-like isoform X2 [Patiria miniata]